MAVHGMAAHDMAVHDMAVHDMAVPDMAVHDMALSFFDISTNWHHYSVPFVLLLFQIKICLN